MRGKVQGIFFLFLVLLSVHSSRSVAQNAGDNIPTYGMNEKFLEHLIKIKIDSVRLAHNLKVLYNDSILYVAAKYHAGYLFRKKDLSHTEPENPPTQTPQKRAEYFGAVNYLVGENVAYTYINTPSKDKKGKVITNSTYNQTATDFALMWVHSPGHYKNIITPDYNSTGLAVWVDQKLQRIYAVQKFANILYKYTFDENKAFFAYSDFKSPPVATSFEGVSGQLHKGRHVHNLKIPKRESQCEQCYDTAGFQFGLSRIQVKDGRIVFSSYDFNRIYDLLGKRKDGFAVEIVSYAPYDCGNPEYYTHPSRRNGQCAFSGRVLKPVYRKKALKGFRAGDKRKKIKKKIRENKVKKYELKLGKLPKDMQGYLELNLVILQKKKICGIMHFSGYCGDTLERFYTLPLYRDTVQEADIREDYKNVSFTIPFRKGKTEYNMSDIKPLTDSLLSENFTADSVIIYAFSSVEGSESLNRQLQEERAGQIIKALKANQKEKLNTKVILEENWPLFEKQIGEKEALKELRGLSRQQVEKLLEDTVRLRKWELYLKEQRRAKIRLRAREIITGKNVEAYLLSKMTLQKGRIHTLLKDSTRKQELGNLLDTMTLYMGVAYRHIKQGSLKPGFFRNFALGKLPVLDAYNTKRLGYIVSLDSSGIRSLDWSRDLYEGLVSLYNNKNRSFFINYNMLTLIQLYGKQMNVYVQDDQQDAYLEELMALCETAEQKELCGKLGLNFWFVVCRSTWEETPPKERALHEKCMINIHNYFATKKMSLEEKNKICRYYLYHSCYDWIMELLWPDYLNKADNPEGMILLAKMLYRNYQETHETAYYDFLKELYNRMDHTAWCAMFIGPCNISFQALDHEPFRIFYCEKCGGYLNYAKSPGSEK